MTFNADFDVRGIPKPQGRPRAFIPKVVKKKGKKKKVLHARVFNPATAEKWKSDIVVAGEPFRPDVPLEDPVEIRIVFWMPRPQRLMREKDPSGAVWYTAKNHDDIDNLIKAVLDALTHDGWWRDDSQVCSIFATKKYHSKLGSPGAQIQIDELEEVSG